MSMLRTPAKKLVREHIQNIKEEATMADAVGAFHAAGLASATGAPNGSDAHSFTVTCTGMADDFQKVQHEIDANLKAKGMRLVTIQYHEDPATHMKTHKCVVMVSTHI